MASNTQGPGTGSEERPRTSDAANLLRLEQTWDAAECDTHCDYALPVQSCARVQAQHAVSAQAEAEAVPADCMQKAKR